MTQRLQVVQADITQLEVGAIVNAANESLAGGGGVDGAIHRAAGPKLNQACREIGGCPTGQACITPGFNLPASYIIHTVGPIWQGGHRGEPDLLASCYQQSLLLADKHDLKTIAFPAISTGVYGYPLEKAADVAVETVRGFLQENATIDRVYLVCFDDRAIRAYQQAMDLSG
jgi:O-acetyl-ADP-ribose deacetylase (regulator of RNase III)